MSIISAIPVIGQVLDKVFNVIDQAVTDKDLANKLKQEIAQMDHTEIMTEIQAKRDIMVAELQQEDKYTKRARPTVIYVGIGAIVFNYCIVPLVLKIIEIINLYSGKNIPFSVAPFELPDGFWIAWGGLVTTYVVGRTFEKRGYQSKLIDLITGRQK